MSFGLMVLGVFVAGARTGRRDSTRDLPALADEAADRGRRPRRGPAARPGDAGRPGGADHDSASPSRRGSRAASGWAKGSRRSDTALHTALELLQPALLVALAGASAWWPDVPRIRTVLVIIAGVFVWLLMFPLYWIWNSPPLHVLVPVQIMPLRVELHDLISIDETPAGWSVEYPNEYGRTFARDLVHLPTRGPPRSLPDRPDPDRRRRRRACPPAHAEDARDRSRCRRCRRTAGGEPVLMDWWRPTGRAIRWSPVVVRHLPGHGDTGGGEAAWRPPRASWRRSSSRRRS